MDYVQHRVFQDPPQELDETWVSGVLIGGVASPYDDVALAHAYLRAAASLVDQALDSKQPYELAFPIFYLYRHALELLLKSIAQPSKPDHKLRPLIQRVDAILQQRVGQGLPRHLKADLLELAKVDPDAQAFRFSRTVKGERLFLEGEYWVELRDLQRCMAEVFNLLVRAGETDTAMDHS